MKKRGLGRTGIEVTELGLGGAFVTARYSDYERSRAAIHRAIELGINYVDTAPGYSNSEEVLGRALEHVDVPLVMATKLGGRPTPFDARDASQLRRSVEESLTLLGRDLIDVLFIHEPERPGQYDWWTDEFRVEGPVMELFESLKSEGVIRFTGIAGTTAYELARLARSGKFDVVLAAFNYDLLWREAELSVLPAAKEMGMGVVIGSPLHQGTLSRRYDAELREGVPWLNPLRRAQMLELYDYLEEIGLPIAEAALRFVVSNPDVSCTLMGARSVEEVELNVAAVEKGPLPVEVLSRLDEIAGRLPFRPFEEPAVLRFDREHRGPGKVDEGRYR